MKKSSQQLMREGAFLTHQQRRDRTEASILRSIQRLRDSGLKPSKAAVSRLCNLSRQHISEHYSHLFRNSFNFIDLFAGIGGMRLGFEKAGGRCVFTSEYDKYPASMYQENFGTEVHGDITKIKPSDIPPHDVLVAGFPCQPFSIAGVSKKILWAGLTGSHVRLRGHSSLTLPGYWNITGQKCSFWKM